MKKAVRAPRRPPSAAKLAPMGISGSEVEVRRQGRLKTVALLQTGRTPLQTLSIPEKAVMVAEDAVNIARSGSPPKEAPACSAGCAWCCYKVVGAAAPEVLRIVARLRQTLTPDEFRLTQDRVIRQDEQRRSLPPDQRSKARPCSLLVDNRCSAYSVRPLTCRGYNSSDARQCELSLDPRNHAVVPAYAPQQRLATMALDGLRAGLAESGLQDDLLELTAALRIAFSDATAEAQWLAGKSVFAAARLP